MPSTIRLATLPDIPALIELMRDFYAEANYALDAVWATTAFTGLLQDANHGLVWIAWEGAAPVGYVVLTFRYSMEFGGIDGFIDDLSVRAAHRRKGFATQLLSALFEECERRGVLAVHVETSSANLPATALYRRWGLEDRQRLLLTKKLTSRRETSLVAPEE